ncbi:MAG: hypothetical protein J7M20_10025 [Deltaproteobacteria bacterium]|nr:hypothetical protein [Deltaproteobacteria bacterium]
MIRHPISRAFLLSFLLPASLSACASGPLSRKSKPIVMIRESGDTGKGIIISHADMRMAVDPNRNALIIYATAEKYREIEG